MIRTANTKARSQMIEDTRRGIFKTCAERRTATF
jgi:hypothetical protein